MAVWDDAYTDEPTHVRIFSDGNEYFVDGADDEGNYTEMCWSFDSFAEAIEEMADFVKLSTEAGAKWKWRVTQSLRHDA